jgi:hypothetical protein
MHNYKIALPWLLLCRYMCFTLPQLFCIVELHMGCENGYEKWSAGEF